VKIYVDGDLEKSLKKLKRDYETNVLPSIKRHQFFQSKGQKERARLQKTIKKYKRLFRKLKQRGF
jgi:ribosomal protein S21